ncbi:MAG: hypothetical protein ACYC6W_10950 [Nitrosotalea sp.]
MLDENYGQSEMQHQIMNEIEVLSTCLEEIGYKDMAKQIRKKYDPKINYGYAQLVQRYIDKNPEKYYLLESLHNVGLIY